nr:DUF4342 domain-containing protein [Clostridia bacterium]
SKIVIKKGEEIIMNLPVNIGIIGTVLFPWAAIGGCIAALGTKCSIELVKEDGSVVNVSEKASSAFETVKDKSSVLYDEVKDKGGDLFEAAKGKSGDLFEAAKGKGETIVNAAKDKSEGIIDAAKGAINKETESAKEAVEEALSKENDFDLSDLDLDEMEEDKQLF